MKESNIKLAVLVPLFFIMLYLFPLGLRDLWSPDELRYAEIAREMVDSGNWIVPTFNNLRYFEKPIMGHWMNALAQVMLGENNFSVRIASALSTLGAAFCVFFLVRRNTNPHQAWVTVAVFLSLFLVANLGSYSVLDSMLNLWLTAAFTALFYAADSLNTSARAKYYGLAGLFCGCALLTKGFLALALPVMVIVPFMLWQHQLFAILRWGWWVIFVTLITTLPWALAVHAAEPDYWHYFFWVEHIQRFAAENAQHSAPAWYYLPFLLLSTLPWVFLAPTAIKQLKGVWIVPLYRYALLWAILPLLFFSAAKGKLVTYILPCMAPIAVLLAHGIIKAYQNKSKGLTLGSLINCAFFSSLALAVIVLNVMGGLPLDADEYYRPWLLVFVLVSWSLLAYASTRATSLNGKVVSYMAMPLTFFLLAWAIIPNISIHSKMPRQFLTEIAPLVTDDAVLIGDYPSTMSAWSWYFKRHDVYLTGSRGELSYGLAYPDASHRFIEMGALNSFISQQHKMHPVLILFRETDIPSQLLRPTQRIEKGRYTLFYYEREPH